MRGIFLKHNNLSKMIKNSLAFKSILWFGSITSLHFICEPLTYFSYSLYFTSTIWNHKTWYLNHSVWKSTTLVECRRIIFHFKNKALIFLSLERTITYLLQGMSEVLHSQLYAFLPVMLNQFYQVCLARISHRFWTLPWNFKDTY